jgi:hypothetical protein
MKIKYTEKQFNYYKEYRKDILLGLKNKYLVGKFAEVVQRLHAEVFKHKFSRPCCPSEWKSWTDALETLYEAYVGKPEPVKLDKPKQTDRLTGDVFPKKATGNPLLPKEEVEKPVFEFTDKGPVLKPAANIEKKSVRKPVKKKRAKRTAQK